MSNFLMQLLAKPAPIPQPGASSVVAQGILGAENNRRQLASEKLLGQLLQQNATDEGADLNAVSQAALETGDYRAFDALQKLKFQQAKGMAASQKAAREGLGMMGNLAKMRPELIPIFQRSLASAGMPIENLTPEQIPAIVDALKDDTKSMARHRQDLMMATASAPTTHVDARSFSSRIEETAFDKATGKGRGEAVVAELNEYRDARKAANVSLRNLRRMERLLPKADTGAGAETRTAIKAVAKDGFGIPLEQLGINDNVAETQALGALMKTVVLDNMEKITGAASDRDVAIVENAGPRITATREGNQIMIDALKRHAQKQIEVSDRVQKILEGKRARGEARELNAADRREIDNMWKGDFFTEDEHAKLEELSQGNPPLQTEILPNEAQVKQTPSGQRVIQWADWGNSQ